MFKKSEANYLVIKYEISKEIAGADKVSLYAEIHDKPEFRGDGAFMLNLLIGIEPLGFRDYVCGLVFGEKSMSKDEMVSFVDSIVAGELEENFELLVKQMFHEAAVFEANPYIPGEHL